MDFTVREMLSTVCDHASSFESRGWMVGTSGNVSVRDEKTDQYWVSVSGLDKGGLSPLDFICLRDGTKRVDPDDERKPSDESDLHHFIYERVPEAKTIYHLHSPSGTWLSRHMAMLNHAGIMQLRPMEMLKGLGFKNHETPTYMIVVENSQEMSIIIDRLLPEWDTIQLPGFFIAGHGGYVWGDSPQAARRHVEVMEFCFQQMMWDRFGELANV